MADPFAGWGDGRYDLSLEERERWLWTEMDPWQEQFTTDQWSECIAAYRRDRGLCGICGQPVDLKVTSGRQQPSIDHIVPLTRGGWDERANIQLAHRGCNSWKGNRLLSELTPDRGARRHRRT